MAMQLEDALRVFETYDLSLLLIGIAVLAAAALPRLLSEQPLSMPLVLFSLGFFAFWLPIGLPPIDPFEHGALAEHLTELGVIIALMGAGLKIDRVPHWKTWSSTWRLLGITMALTIPLAALAGSRIAAFVPATAALLGAVLAPTDPVLASDVQVGAPGKGSADAETQEVDPGDAPNEDEVRFSLTSEAGLNDGLAFPFTNLAIAMALFGAHPDGWFGTWLIVDVGYKLVVAIALGLLLGYITGTLITHIPAKTQVARAMGGLSALGATLIIYGGTEYAGGYGFIAVFIGALVIRHHKGEPSFHEPMFLAVEKVERLLAAVILLALGGIVASGILDPLDAPLILTALLIFFVIRPLGGIVGLIGFRRAPWRERLFIAFFGIRGIGSLYYMSFALNQADFEGTRELWAVVTLVIILSIFVHGTTAASLTTYLDARREEEATPRDTQR